MKRITTFLIAFLIGFSTLQAQNWSLLQKDTVQFLRQQLYDFGIQNNNTSNTFGLTLLIDSVLNSQNTTVTYFTDDYSDLSSEYDSCAFASPSIFGDSMIAMNDTAVFFIDSSKSVLWISNSNNWTFYSSGSEHLQIQLDSVEANGNDSLKYYSFNVNAPLNSELHKFDTAQIVVSKSRGMIKGFDLSHFPDTLIELEYFRQGSLTNREIYDYEIGDELHFNTYGWLMSPAGLNQYIHKILNKVVHNTDSVTYTIEQIHLDNQNNVSIDTILKTYSLNKVISDGIFVDGLDLSRMYETWLFSDFYSRPAYMSSLDYDYWSMPFCRVSVESNEIKEYVFGVGIFKHIFDGTDMNPEYYDENLLYYKKGNETWGTPLTISVGVGEVKDRKIEIFPNPIDDHLTIKGLEDNWSYKMYNIAGEKVKEGYVSATEDNINVEQFQPGMYFLIINANSKTITHKIIVM